MQEIMSSSRHGNAIRAILTDGYPLPIQIILTILRQQLSTVCMSWPYFFLFLAHALSFFAPQK